MWLIFGVGAVVFAILNLICAFQNKNAKWFRFISLALTALAACACYSDEAARVMYKDWVGIEDIVPTMSKGLWICTIGSILVNSVSLLKENRGEGK